MSTGHRIILFLAAFPFSVAFAAGTYILLEVARGPRLIVATMAFVVAELVLGYAASQIPPRMGVETIPGREAKVLSDFAEEPGGSYVGYVQLDGERWRARVLGGRGHVPLAGGRVKVERVDGLTLLVCSVPTHTNGGAAG